ncbi:MAG: carboxypeptidase regulatory-like domain-containing protein [Lachnospiraceae bacterium]|nr:carboxypeptidase regulatory-like domain-containing protein [Lachnospiraceae bacterium]
MKKKFLSGILAFAMSVSLLAGVPQPVMAEATATVLEDVALGKSVTVSKDRTQNPLSYILDGDETTVWSPGADGTAWLEVDLGQDYTIDKLILSTHDWYGFAYKAEIKKGNVVSGEESEYKLFYEQATESGTQNTVETADPEDDGYGRYVKITITKPSNGQWIGLADLKVMAKIPAVDGLYTAIEKAEAVKNVDYTEETWTALQTTIAAAKEVAENEDSTVEDIEKAIADLDTAIAALKEKEVVIEADYVNDQFWQDTDGNTIYSQGGGIFKFEDKYYWYGVKYEEAEAYAKNPRQYYTKTDVFAGITCYSSTDLKNWKFEGLVAEPDDVYNAEIMGTTTYDMDTKTYTGEERPNTAVWVGRLGVTKLEDGTYALLVQHECADEGNKLDGDTDEYSKQVLVLTADAPNGQFTWNNRINMLPKIGTSNTGDQTVFIDDDGTGWLVYSYGSGRGKMYLSKIQWNEDQSKVELGTPYMVYQGAGREGNCMFKYNGKYYLCASDLFGWNASHGYYMVIDPGEMTLEEYLKSDSFKVVKDLKLMDGTSDDYCHVSQTGFFYTVEGTEQDTVIFCGDRWADFAGNGLGFNQWCPLSFNEKDEPYFNSLSAWNMDTTTGKWSVADDNNYAKNGSFEADRVAVDEIAGWTKTINKGEKAVSNITEMNDANTVTGKGSLKIGSAYDFDVKVSQEIASSLYVTLEDGVYKLSAKVKNSGDFENLQLFATSGGKTFATSFAAENTSWTTVRMNHVVVADNQVEIGFLATGAADALCIIDDVTFTKAEDAVIGEGSIKGKVTGDVYNAGKVLTVTAVSDTDSYSVDVTLSAEAQDYVIDGLADGTYTVSFAAKNCIVPTAKEIVVAGGEVVLDDIQVTNNGGNVSGKITTEGTGLADATVTLSKEGMDDITATTTEDGTYQFEDVEVGTYTITFVKRGYGLDEGAPTTVEVLLNDTVTVEDVGMTKNCGDVAGTVVNSCGIPVSNATVILRDKADNSLQYTAKTDKNGEYSIKDVVEGNYVAVATTMEKTTDAWKELNAGSSNLVVVANQESDGDLQFAVDMTNLIKNPTFDGKDLTGWTNGAQGSGGYRTGKTNTHGTYQLAPWSTSAFTMNTYQKITGLKNGTYIATCWENASYLAPTDKLEFYAKDSTGNELARENIPANSTYDTVVLIAEVTDGTLTIGVDGNLAANSWANIDDFHLGLLGEYHATAERHEAAEATCTEDGHNTTYWSCPECNKFFKDVNGEMDTSVAYDKITDVTEVTEAIGHSYGEPEFIWAEDYSAKAKFACGNCEETKSKKCNVTAEETTAPSCTAEGLMTYTATITFEDKTYTDTKTGVIAKAEHSYTTITEADGAIVEKCSVCGDVKSRTEGNKTETDNKTETTDKTDDKTVTESVQLAEVTLEEDTYTYSGKEIKPVVTVKDTAGNVIDAANYTVSYTNNKNVGKATVTITAGGKYTGTVTANFTINPKSTKFTKAAAKSKGMKLTWKKQKTQVTGYEIRYSTSKKFKSAKKVVVKKAKTTSKTISKLKAKKKYYVQIRTYKTVGKAKYYSEWSKYKTVKTKK